MLVEFRVSNYRSIKEEVCLSLVAGRDREHRDTHLVTPELQEERQYDPLVRSAVLYGANAAGKSNLLSGLSTMRSIVTRSHQTNNALDRIVPFKLDPDSVRQESTFEVICIVQGVPYQYGFAASSEKIYREWLYAWPHGRTQCWLERNEQDWVLGDKLQGDKGVWKRATRDETLFLTTAVALNSEQLRSLFDWFDTTLDVFRPDSLMIPNTYIRQADNKETILDFLRAADLAITDIRNKEDFTSAPGWVSVTDVLLRHDAVLLRHDTPGTGYSAELRLSEESSGTQKIFYMAGVWIPALTTGQVIVIDEMDTSLHPVLVQHLVALFHDPDRNSSGAQLVFSTHNSSLLDQDTFRRDQIWFCERNQRQETQLYALAEFRSRKGLEDLERSYLAGRYGAVPYIPANAYTSSG